MTDEEEDWFESALREDESGDDSDGSGSERGDSERGETGAAGDVSDDAGSTSAPEEAGDGDGTDPFGFELDGADGDGDAAADPSAPDGVAVDAESDGFDGETADPDAVADSDPLADSADADPSGSDPFGADGESESFGDLDESDGFGNADELDGFDEGDQSDPFGEGDGDDLFEQDFASAFEGSGGMDGSGMAGGGFGFDLEGGGGSFDSGEFDDEAFESDISRIELGIDGLDEMVQGGVPARSLMVVMGSAGTGKTTFGLQFLERALADGESAVFITLEETRERILSTAVEKGWDFETYEDAGQLAVVDLDPIEMANSLKSIRSELPALVEEFGASRLVLDSVSLLEMMYDDQATRRSEVYDFTKSLKAAGVTTMLTSEASEDTPFASRYGIIEYLTDAVFVLRYVRPEDFRETRLAVEIQKIRDANHSRETKPYEITNEGISVYRQANIF